jgi:GTP cyclohydrolase I
VADVAEFAGFVGVWTKTMTSAMLGAFRDPKSTRDEFLALANHRSSGV